AFRHAPVADGGTGRSGVDRLRRGGGALSVLPGSVGRDLVLLAGAWEGVAQRDGPPRRRPVPRRTRKPAARRPCTPPAFKKGERPLLRAVFLVPGAEGGICPVPPHLMSAGAEKAHYRSAFRALL